MSTIPMMQYISTKKIQCSHFMWKTTFSNSPFKDVNKNGDNEPENNQWIWFDNYLFFFSLLKYSAVVTRIGQSI